MAISSYGVTLMKGTGETPTYSKLVDIKSFPDLGGAPEMLETTTLSDKMQTYINGIQSMDALEFTANYDPDDYATLKAVTGKQKFAVYFSPDNDGTGSNGKYGWEGELSVYINGGDVNAVVDMTISISPSTEITELS